MHYIELPEEYEPLEEEEYMNSKHLEYYRQKLNTWKAELLEESQKTIDHLKYENWSDADDSNRASLESEAGVELKTRNRYRKLISKIDDALERIENGEYGYCEETGEKIGLKRLKARPIATLCIEAQERHENVEKQRNLIEIEEGKDYVQ